MISVIIPLMDKFHYKKCVGECIDSLSQQSIELEIIVSEHKPQRFIEKNRLLNEGFKKASCDIIWHCDADFTLEDEYTLERAVDRLTDVVAPVFYSEKFKKMKIADGGLMIRRSVLERHGPLDEKLIGISYVTFPFLRWCMKNTDFKVCEDFIVTHRRFDSRKKIHHPTINKLRPLYKKTIDDKKYEMFDLRGS